jgi:hypothetical protein
MDWLVVVRNLGMNGTVFEIIVVVRLTIASKCVASVLESLLFANGKFSNALVFKHKYLFNVLTVCVCVCVCVCVSCCSVLF